MGKVIHEVWRAAIILSVDFSAETLQVKREWHDIIKVLKGGWTLPTKDTVSGKTILQKWKRNKNFLSKQKLREIFTIDLLTRNAKGSLSSWNRQILSKQEHKTIWKYKAHQQR